MEEGFIVPQPHHNGYEELGALEAMPGPIGSCRLLKESRRTIQSPGEAIGQEREESTSCPPPPPPPSLQIHLFYQQICLLKITST